MANANLEKEHRMAWVARLLGFLNLFFAGVGTIALLFNIAGFLGLPSSFTEGLDPKEMWRLQAILLHISRSER